MSTILAQPSATSIPALVTGSDLTSLMPDLGPSEITLLAELFEPGPGGRARPFDPQRLSGRARWLLPQSRSLGAPRLGQLPTANDPRELPVSIHVLGEKIPALRAALEHNSSHCGRKTRSVNDYNLVTPQGNNPPQAKDVGLRLIAARRSGGVSRALYDFVSRESGQRLMHVVWIPPE